MSLPAVSLSAGEKAVYEAVWKDVVDDNGQLDAGKAVTLLRDSTLPDGILHEIWEIADAPGEGYLLEAGFHIALKLVALKQAGHPIDAGLLTKDAVVADLGRHTKKYAHLAKPPAAPDASVDGGDTVDWSIGDDDRARYCDMFTSLGPVDGCITGKKARKVLMKTGLPTDALGMIWECSDIDGDGNLDKEEFCIAMALVGRCLEGTPAPSTLPKALMPPSKRSAGKQAVKPPAVSKPPEPEKVQAPPPRPPTTKVTPPPAPPPTAPTQTTDASSPASTGGGGAAGSAASDDWVVKAGERKTYDAFFKTADKDGDGMVAGGDIMKIFLTSKLPKDTLAHIWNLVDVDDVGAINSEQFALAMHFIAQTVKGKAAPKRLLPHHVPPSMRGRVQAEPERDTADSSGSLEDSDTKKELIQQRATNTQLKKDLQAQANELKHEEEELKQMLAEIKALRADEKKMRQELKEGKEKLQEVLAQKRKAKQDKKRIEGKLTTMSASQAKINHGLQASGYTGGTTSGAPAEEESVDTFGMSMEDYFGQ